MHVGGQHVADGFVDESMTADDWQPPESLRHDNHAEVPAAVRGARMPGMTMAIVDDLEIDRFER